MPLQLLRPLLCLLVSSLYIEAAKYKFGKDMGKVENKTKCEGLDGNKAKDCLKM
jgi:hypothetical protein